MIERINKLLEKAETLFSVILLTVIVVLVFIAAIARSLGMPIIWSVEIAQILFMVLSFLCVDLTLKKNQHVGISYFIDKLSMKAKTICQLFVLILMLGFLLFSLIKGFDMISLYKYRKFSATGIPYKYVMPILPIAMMVMSLTIVEKIQQSIQCLKKLAFEVKEVEHA